MEPSAIRRGAALAALAVIGAALGALGSWQARHAGAPPVEISSSENASHGAPSAGARAPSAVTRIAVDEQPRPLAPDDEARAVADAERFIDERLASGSFTNEDAAAWRALRERLPAATFYRLSARLHGALAEGRIRNEAGGS